MLQNKIELNDFINKKSSFKQEHYELPFTLEQLQNWKTSDWDFLNWAIHPLNERYFSELVPLDLYRLKDNKLIYELPYFLIRDGLNTFLDAFYKRGFKPIECALVSKVFEPLVNSSMIKNPFYYSVAYNPMNTLLERFSNRENLLIAGIGTESYISLSDLKIKLEKIKKAFPAPKQTLVFFPIRHEAFRTRDFQVMQYGESYQKIFLDVLGDQVKFIAWEDLSKINDFRNFYSCLLSENHSIYADNYLEHLILSKGAKPILIEEKTLNESEVFKRESAYHGLIISSPSKDIEKIKLDGLSDLVKSWQTEDKRDIDANFISVNLSRYIDTQITPKLQPAKVFDLS